MVKAGEFRDDLYYRLNAAAILVPPLRERREAIAAFVAHFIEHYNRLFGKDDQAYRAPRVDALCAYRWPGNVRELGHAIESAVLMTENDRIDPRRPADPVYEGAAEASEPAGDSIAPARAYPISTASRRPSVPTSNWPYSLDAVIREASKVALIRALQATEGNCHRAAELLGVSRYTVYRMLNRFGLGEGRTYRNLRKATGSA